MTIEEVTVLGDKNAIATIAVKDVNVAKKFYEGTLGLKPEPSEGAGVLSYKSGNANVLVYKSDYAGTTRPPLRRGRSGTNCRTSCRS